MKRELADLESLARELEGPAAAADPELAARARRTAERLAAGRFHVAVLGEFKRGKSTLVNALLGRALLPTGVLPLTAAATEVRYGAEGATVVLLDGSRQEIELSAIADYVTEGRNPGNDRGVERVEVRVPIPLLEPGVVFVDTPGIGSVYEHNSEAGRSALLEADGAIVVLSVETPLSEQERELLHRLSERQARTFIVANRADHLEGPELDAVRRFITEIVAGEFGRKPELYCLAARPALAARVAGRDPGAAAVDFGRFLAAFEDFVAEELVGAGVAAARSELARVGQELEDTLTVRAAALDLDVETLTRRVEEFRAAADLQRQALEEDRIVLDHDADALARHIGERLGAFAARAPAEWLPVVQDAARTLPLRRLDDGLRAVVERCVHDGFEAFRTEEATRVEEAWAVLAVRFRGRTQERVNAVRAAAADLLATQLREVAVPEVAEERERFFYLFLHIGSSTEGLSRLARRLLPATIVRRRLLAAARTQLVSEFDKHAGRARWDLAQRLDAVRHGSRRSCARSSKKRSRRLCARRVTPTSSGSPRHRRAPARRKATPRCSGSRRARPRSAQGERAGGRQTCCVGESPRRCGDRPQNADQHA